ncbi:MAG: hypothetical protein V3T14_09310 [Myxococcota bacterium]
MELSLGRHRVLGEPGSTLRDPRLAIIHILLVTYIPTAYVYVIRGSRRAIDSLRPGLRASDSEVALLEAAVGRYREWWPTLASLGVLAFTVYTTYATTPKNPYDWTLWTPEVAWHRVLTPFLAWWSGRLVYAVLTESRRLSRLAKHLGPLDLMDLSPLAPFSRQALSNVIVVVGLASILTLFLLDVGNADIVLTVWLGIVVVALASALFPLRGVRRAIHAAKATELAWCNEALQQAREAWSRGAPSPGPAHVGELVAYRDVVKEVREWPVDTSTLVRFALFVLLPLGSWLGGAFVERAIDSLLD